MPRYITRAARPTDLPFLLATSNSARTTFATIPSLSDLASPEKDTSAKLLEILSHGLIYLVETTPQIAGFIATQPHDNVVYIAEIATHADYRGKGIGSVLLEAVFEYAVAEAKNAGNATARVSLTAYADVPWNGVWYRRKGFREVEAGSLGAWHVEKMRVDKEERGLVREGCRRCCMVWEREVG